MEFQHQAKMMNRAPPGDPAPPISGTADILQKVLAQNKELMQLLYTKYGINGRNNTSRPPNTSIGPRQGHPCNPMPTCLDKYFWTHGKGSHKVGDCNSKTPGHKDKAAMESRMDGSNYGCTE